MASVRAPRPDVRRALGGLLSGVAFALLSACAGPAVQEVAMPMQGAPSMAPITLAAPPAAAAPSVTPAATAAAATPPQVASRSERSAALLGQGLASWYGGKFHGRRTASGERFDRHALTAAHRTLPFGTRVRVRSLATGQEVVVRINDRGPHKPSRIIDLSEAAITALGVRHRGVTAVELLPE